MSDPYQDAKGWLELCQESIRLGLSANEIPFSHFLSSLSLYLPCQMQIDDNPPISMSKIGSIHPISHMISYRGPGDNESGDQYLLGGISLANAKIIKKEPPPEWEDPLY